MSSWCAALGRVSGVGIGGRHLLLLMHGLFGWVLLLQLRQILTYVVFHVRHFRRLFAGNATLLIRIRLNEAAIQRQAMMAASD